MHLDLPIDPDVHEKLCAVAESRGLTPAKYMADLLERAMCAAVLWRPASKGRPLTSKQKAVLAYITESVEEYGRPPTLREIGEEIGVPSTNGVNDHLRALERKGYIERDEMVSRGIRLVRAA